MLRFTKIGWCVFCPYSLWYCQLNNKALHQSDVGVTFEHMHVRRGHECDDECVALGRIHVLLLSLNSFFGNKCGFHWGYYYTKVRQIFEMHNQSGIHMAKEGTRELQGLSQL